MPLTLLVVIVSTRPGRAGKPIGDWFNGFAGTEGGFDVALADLAGVGLPLYDEPHHPRLRRYEHEHTRRWSALVDAADAFVFVAPEYNFSPAPSLLNAVDYLLAEWSYKPAAFVSYGGISGGLRAAQATKLVLTAVGVMPIPEAVTITAFREHLADGVFTPADRHLASARTMLAELRRWAEALKTIRSAPA